MTTVETSITYTFTSVLEKSPNFWHEVLGAPLGNIRFSKEEEQRQSPLWLLPNDIITLIFDRAEYDPEGPLQPFRFLEVSKFLYRLLVPSFRFIQVHDLRKDVVGLYLNTELARSSKDCYTWAYQVCEDGRFTSKQIDVPYGKYGEYSGSAGKATHEGHWELKRGSTTDIYFHPSREEEGKKQVVKRMCLSSLATDRANASKFQSWDDLKKNMPLPFRQKKIMRKCGVPLEMQKPGDADCCYEIVDLIVEEVWNEGLDVLGAEVKKDITNRVSRRCMMPPGMTDAQIKVAIAEEIAVCDEWRASFQSACDSNIPEYQ